MDTFRILREGQEIARVTADNLQFAKISKRTGRDFDTEMVDDPHLFKVVDSVDNKSLVVIALSHYRNLTVEKI